MNTETINHLKELTRRVRELEAIKHSPSVDWREKVEAVAEQVLIKRRISDDRI